MNFAPHCASPKRAKVNIEAVHFTILYMRAAHCIAILCQFVNVFIVLESINGQSQRTDCSCTMLAVGIPMVWGSSTCAWCVCTGWLMHSAYEPCGRVNIVF